MFFRIASRGVFLSIPRVRYMNIAPATSRLSALQAHLTPKTTGFTSVRTMTTQELPKTMYGVEINGTGGTEVLEYKEDMKVLTPGDGEILVKNEFTGVNYIDTFVMNDPTLRTALTYKIDTSALVFTQRQMASPMFSAASLPAQSLQSAQGRPSDFRLAIGLCISTS